MNQPMWRGLLTALAASPSMAAVQGATGQVRSAVTTQGAFGVDRANVAEQSACSRHAVGGFTLLELLVVILIIGLLTGIVAPRFLNQIARSETTTAKAQIDAFDKALQAYRIDMGRFPSEGEGLKALVAAPGNDPRWRGPYLRDSVPVDPWGTPYQYRFPSTRGKDYDVLSLGRDRSSGGAGDDADISN